MQVGGYKHLDKDRTNSKSRDNEVSASQPQGNGTQCPNVYLQNWPENPPILLPVKENRQRKLVG